MVAWLFQSADYNLSANPPPPLPNALQTFDSLLANYEALGINTVTISSRVPIDAMTGALEGVRAISILPRS